MWHISDRASPEQRSDPAIVVQDRDAVDSAPHVALKPGGTHGAGSCEGLERVLGGMRPSAPVGEQDWVGGPFGGGGHRPSLPVGHPSTRRIVIVIVDGGWVLVALGLVLAVVATSHLSALLARELAATTESLARLERLSVAVGDLARSTERFGIGVARVGRR